MLDDKLEDMNELAAGVAVLHDDLLGPVGEHGVAVLHAARHAGREDLQGLAHHAPRLHRVGLQQRVEHLGGSGCRSMTFLVGIRIRGSMPLTNGSRPCYFHH